MEIMVNGESREVADDLNVDALLEMLDLVGKRLAVEVNLEIIPRSTFAKHRFNAGDRIEIVHAIGGG
ncbi:MAG: sulfur carrier protein ThiS [Gammaproteobacteria bacterium]|nr:sulfur carrier protein ThiS [Gammaproteobacteria bacterium]